MKARILGFFFSLLIVAGAKGQTIDGVLYTNFNNYYKWRGGGFDSTLLIPTIPASIGRSPGAIYYKSADSSLYSWSGTQWRKVGDGASIPTLQQVTTAGKVTTDTIKAAAFRIPTAIGTDVIFSDDGQAYRASFKIAGSSTYAWLRGGQLELINGSGFLSTLNNTNGTKTNTINLPDSTGVLTQRVSINGTTYNTANNGVVDLGNTDTATVVKAYVTNAESVTITKGQVVYIFGASGDRAAVKLAKNTSDTFSSKTLGIVRADIAAGQAGWVTTQGQVSGINLGAYTAGDILWLDSVPGGFTKTKPVAPYHSVFVGVVERANAGNGLIYVKPQNGQELGELHDTKITSPTNNQVLAYTAATDIWENKGVTTALGYTPLNVTDTATMLNGRLSGITLNTSSAIHTTPVTFSRVGGAWSGTLSLANQSGFTIFRRASGTGTPSFGTIDSSYFGGQFKNQVEAAQSTGIEWMQADSLFALNSASNGFHQYDEPIFRNSSSATPPGQFYNSAFVGLGTWIGDVQEDVNYIIGSTGTSASGTASSFHGSSVGNSLSALYIPGSSSWFIYTTRVRIPTLNDGTQKFYVNIGIQSTIPTASITEGVGFLYDLDGSTTGSSASANWQTYSANASTRTFNQNHTGVSVAANTWTRLKIIFNSTAAYYYVDDVLIATHRSNLPAGDNITPINNIIKTAGIVARTYHIDYHTIDIKYSTPR